MLLRQFIVVIVAAVIIQCIQENKAVRNAEDSPEPEQVETLETGQEDERNIVRQSTLVLLSLPVELVWTHGFELVELGEDDAEV